LVHDKQDANKKLGVEIFSLSEIFKTVLQKMIDPQQKNSLPD
jgi:hypothetical protein